jgi:phytanoyl-CoA hydroxylase
MISDQDVAFYRDNGYLLVPDALQRREVEELRRVTDEFVERARQVAAHDEVYDLEDSHSAAEPRVRRIKTPHLWHPVYTALVRHPNILTVLKKLWGPSIRFDVSKLNMKAAVYGAPVEWHQDWAFYPHTNDDLAAVGIMIDAVDEQNGPLLVIPGTHKAPIFDHHEGGVFCGAMDPARREVDYDAAVALTGPAGSITIHHCRTVHGSATNTSGRPRRFLLHQYRAADAWPLLAGQPGFDDFRSKLLCGEDTLEPRMERIPVRLPLPPAPHQGSIYENQRARGSRYFQTAGDLEKGGRQLNRWTGGSPRPNSAIELPHSAEMGSPPHPCFGAETWGLLAPASERSIRAPGLSAC